MRGKEIYKIYAPEGAKWTQWVRPVPFVAIDTYHRQPIGDWLDRKAMFLKLITVSGIGPKMAITILSGMKLSDLVVAIVSGDSNLLSKIKGLGKKSAERICLELKDKISATSMNVQQADLLDSNYNENALNDAVETLINLGVNKNEAYRLARSKATADTTAEEIILKVLRELGR